MVKKIAPYFWIFFSCLIFILLFITFCRFFRCRWTQTPHTQKYPKRLLLVTIPIGLWRPILNNTRLCLWNILSSYIPFWWLSSVDISVKLRVSCNIVISKDIDTDHIIRSCGLQQYTYLVIYGRNKI